MNENLNTIPDIKISVKQTFGIDSNLEVDAFSTKNESVQEINVEDKSFLHQSHKSNSPNKFHIKITIVSDELKNYIHSIQLLVN